MKRLAFVFAMLMCVVSFGQEFRATITGRVTDPTGAVIPNATVVVTNTDTGVPVTIGTDASGNYTAPFLLPATYSVSATAAGFSKFTRDGVKILSGQKVQIDLELAVGAESQEVRVTAAAPLIEAATSTSGQVLTSGEIENLPDNGRSPLGLAKSMYGVVAKQKNSVVQARPFDNSAASDYSLGGGNSQSNEYLLNGVPNMQNSSRMPGFSPLQDSVQEVRVDLFQSDASYGDTSGGTVNLVTKAGTNSFHGAANWFNQFSAINAQQRCFTASCTTPATRQNQYGVFLSGPVWIPKLYNGRNKLFFAYAYEGFRDTVPAPGYTTVPTDAERTGDFSALLGVGKTVTGTRCTVSGKAVTSSYNSYQLFDPWSAVPDPQCPNSVLRQPLITNGKSNVIPQARISPIALAYMKFFPEPNQVGNPDGSLNYFYNVPNLDNYNSHSGRLDYSINDSNKIFFEIHRSEWFRTTSNIFNNIATGALTYTVHQGGLFDYVHTFGPTATLDSRISLTRTYANNSLPSSGFDNTTLGLPGYLDQNAATSMTRIQFNSSNSYAGLSTTPGGLTAFDTIQFFSAFTKVWGRHTVKVGPDFRNYKNNTYSPGAASGSLQFQPNFFNVGGGAAAALFGADLASFIEGIPTNGSYNIAYPLTYNSWYWGAFIQDDWRVNPQLTVNLGLRGETETGINESHNRAVIGFDPSAVNSVALQAQKNYSAVAFPELPAASFSATGGLIFATPSERNEYATPWAYWSPRIGFAYAPAALKDLFVVRGGFGIYINPYNNYYTPQSYGFTAASTLTSTNNGGLTPAASFADPFPASNPIIQPTGSSLGVNQNLGSSITIRPDAVKAPYSERWSMDVQVQLAKNLMLNVGYLGNHQVHLTFSNCVSCIPQLPFLSRSPMKDSAQQTNLGTANITNPFLGLPNMTGSLATSAKLSKFTLLQAFPQFSNVTQQLVPGQSATYNALMVRLYKRLSNGLTFNVNYTYSHNLITSQLNQGGPLTYQENASDFPNHLSITGVYELPFGTGKRFLGHSNRWVNAVIGGYTVNTIYQYLSGAALAWGGTGSGNYPLFANGTSFDHRLTIHPRNINVAFDTTLFNTDANSQPSSTYNYRTFPLFYGRQDATNNLDASIIKDFNAGERVRIQYRFEMFNALNHVNFGSPNVTPTSSSFATINSTSSVARVLQQGLVVRF